MYLVTLFTKTAEQILMKPSPKFKGYSHLQYVLAIWPGQVVMCGEKIANVPEKFPNGLANQQPYQRPPARCAYSYGCRPLAEAPVASLYLPWTRTMIMISNINNAQTSNSRIQVACFSLALNTNTQQQIYSNVPCAASERTQENT